MAHSGTVICMCNVPEKKNPHLRRLTSPLPCLNMDGTMGLIPYGFEWDGSSAELLFDGLPKIKRCLLRILAEPLNFFMRSVFPRHRHPIASCRHDWRCRRAKTQAERKWADEQFRIDVARTSWWITAAAGYAGVRIGAWLGVGVYNY